MSQRRVINRALTRPETVGGGEKLPVGIVVGGFVMFALMGWMFLSIPAAVAAAILLFVGLPLVRRLAKADPQMVAVYIANLKYRAAYPARTPGHVAVGGDRSSSRMAGHLYTAGFGLLAAAGIFWSGWMALGAAAVLVLAFLTERRAKRAAEG